MNFLRVRHAEFLNFCACVMRVRAGARVTPMTQTHAAKRMRRESRASGSKTSKKKPSRLGKNTVEMGGL
jgi:hypothetical protein